MTKTPSPTACLLAALLVAIAIPVVANHAQTSSGNVIVFDHVTGNEWWVEVALSGQDAGSVVKVEAMDTNGAWVTLEKKSWGPYAASFHIEPGNQVRFRASWSGGAQQVSCWFTHPAGVEQCSTSTTTTTTSTTTTTTGTGGTFDATFTGVRGNEWWVQANVATNGPSISKVDVRVFANNAWGNWMPVAKQSWGWGSSYHILQGNVVQLRATASDGQTDLSSCRQWIPPSNTDATIVTCPGGGGGGTTNVWNRKVVQAQADNYPGDLAIGDADRDGKSETYVAGDVSLTRIASTATTTVSSQHGWNSVAVGDGDNDGKVELYAIRMKDDYSGSELHRFSWSGSQWMDLLVFDSPGNWMHAVTVGDVDVYGGRDVYVGRSLNSAAQVLQAHWDSVNGVWRTEVVTDLGDDGSFLDVWNLWIADFDRTDSNLELAVLTGGRGYSNAWIVDHGPPAPNVPSQWRTTRLDTHAGFPAGLTAGDVDGDGKTELILGGDYNGLVLFRQTGTDPYTPQYTMEEVLLDLAPSEVFFGDGDNDGLNEVYVSSYCCADAHVSKAAYRNGVWSNTTIGTLVGVEPTAGRIVVGDGDGNGKREVYLATFDYGDTSHDGDEVGRVLQYSYGPAVTQPAFDATFSGVSGNQWWVQANVAANEPLLKVEARVNCGQTYVPLTKQSWGGWAASFQIANGAKVTFRATSTDGDVDVSGGYIWPNATPTTGC